MGGLIQKPENSWLQGTLFDIKRLHTDTETKHHTRANKFQGKTYQANSPATKEHNPELQDAGCQKSHQTTDNSKLTIGYFTALQIEEIQLHPPEYQHKLP